MKKFLAALLILGGIFSANFASANVEKIDSVEGIFQPLTTGTDWYATVVNCNEWISLRREPSVYSERIYKIPLGSTVIVYQGQLGERSGSPNNGFYYTEYNGARGWCLQEYIRLDAVKRNYM